MAAKKAVAYCTSREGKNTYTQSQKRYQVGEGFSDCSSLVWWAYKKAYGINIGTWTGEQLASGELIEKYDMQVRPLTDKEIAKLQPGDLVFFGDGSGAHVEIYAGEGRLFGHGSGTPSYKDAKKYTHPAGLRESRRYYTETLKEEGPFLTRGDRSDWVYVLQAMLCVRGCHCDIDGVFGPETEKALKDYQKPFEGFCKVGECDRVTWLFLIGGVEK